MSIAASIVRGAAGMNEMPKIFARSAEEAFHEVLSNLSLYGAESSPRGMKIKELLNVNITISNPRNRIVYCPERKFSLPYALGELTWYLCAKNDLESMKYYSKFMERGTDDGVTLNSAYGYRIFGKHEAIKFDQWDHVKKLLTKDKDSRQAVIHLHTPNNKKTNDEVCTMSLQFLIRDGKLDLITTMRSNDIILGFTYDVFAFTVLQELMANELGVELGKYHHNVGSMHIYENKFELLDKHSYTDLGSMDAISMEDTYEMAKIELETREFVNDIKGRYAKIGEYDSKKSKGDVVDNMLDKVLRLWNSKKPIDNDVEEFVNSSLDRLCKIKDNELVIMSRAAFLMKAVKEMGLKVEEYQEAIINKVQKNKNEMAASVLQCSSNFSKGGRKVIVDGVDKAGKTTLIESLKEELGMKKALVKHFGVPSSKFKYYDNYVHDLRLEHDIIMDRFFLSEIVYGCVLRGETKFTPEDLISACLILRENKAKVIVIIPSTKEKEIEIRKSMMSTQDEQLIPYVEEINKSYRCLAEMIKSMGVDVEVRDVER